MRSAEIYHLHVVGFNQSTCQHQILEPQKDCQLIDFICTFLNSHTNEFLRISLISENKEMFLISENCFCDITKSGEFFL